MKTRIHAFSNMIRIFNFLILLLLHGCSVPDLKDKDIFKIARKEAVEISVLKREFMYGMMWLYTDDDNETFSGWVKESYSNKSLKNLGYLENGQKQGFWIGWHENGQKESLVEWNLGYLHGSYEYWHPNGKVHVVGQTIEGEMNGEWKEYYTTGRPEAHSDNTMGKLIWKKVWLPNGQRCIHSEVKNGNGFYFEYNEDGNNSLKRVYKNGREIKTSTTNSI